MTNAPVPFEPHESGAFLHGTKSVLAIGDLLVPGRESNYEAGRVMHHVYLTRTLDAAAWGAELASGGGEGHIYIVEPTGELEDDPNVTDKRFPAIPPCPTELANQCEWSENSNWIRHSPERIRAMRERPNSSATRRGRDPRLSDGPAAQALELGAPATIVHEC